MNPFLYEVPPEIPDGSRRVFSTRVDFITGATTVILRGLERRKTDSDWGWTELPPNQIQLATAPPVGDKLVLGYIPRGNHGHQ